ncbi:unnamed protein product [Cylindrotheca closterium]|nr:unnamed protein product [Cylindrotheca closterium]
MNNHHPIAVEQLHEALVHMKGNMAGACCPQSPLTPRPKSARPRAARHHATLPHYVKERSSNRENMFLYLNELVLDDTTDQHPSTFAIYCAVTLFNVAILYHVEGLAKGRMALMDKAHQMYQASLHFLNGLDLNNDTVFLVNLANHNNMAQIELEKGMVDAPNGRLVHSFSLLQSIKSRALDILSDTELRGFLLNSSLQGKISSAAAA